jgi:internalin A
MMDRTRRLRPAWHPRRPEALDVTRDRPVSVCPCQQGSGKNCAELFEYDDLHGRLMRNPPRGEIECRKSGDVLDVQRLLLGLTPVRRDATKADIDRLSAMFEKFTDTFTDQAELVQRTLLRHTRVTQDQQEVKCPSVFTIVPVKTRHPGATYEMRLSCEEPGGWHPLPGDGGRYKLTESPDWLRKLARIFGTCWLASRSLRPWPPRSSA